MTWQIVDPALCADRETRFVDVGIPTLPDHIDYEGIVGKAFSRPSDRDFMASGGIIVIATRDGYPEVRRLADRASLLRRQGLVSELRRLGLERKIAALQWRSDQ